MCTLPSSCAPWRRTVTLAASRCRLSLPSPWAGIWQGLHDSVSVLVPACQRIWTVPTRVGRLRPSISAATHGVVPSQMRDGTPT